MNFYYILDESSKQNTVRKENNMRLDEKRLRIEALKQGVSQVDLMHKTGISRATLSKVYNGGSCSLNTAFKICKALNIDLDELVKE